MKPTIVLLYDHFYPDHTAGGPVTSLSNLADLLKDKIQMRIVTGSKEFSSGQLIEGIANDQWLQWNGIPIWYATGLKGLKRAFMSLPAESLVFLNGVFSLKFFLYPLYFSRRRGFRTVVSPRGMLQ